jgi:hypothetical protein
MSKIVVFYDEAFPYAGERPCTSSIQQLHERFGVSGVDQLPEKLENADSLIYLHGPYFPKAIWPCFISFLKQGKGLVFLGGAPFKIPVYRDESGEWVKEAAQTGYHQQLQIHEALPVDPGPIAKLEHHRDLPLFAGRESLFTVEPTYGLVLHVTRTNDQPDEYGSSGPMDAHIYPLLKGISGCGMHREVAASAVLIENTKGGFAGGRWVFVNQVLRSVFWQGGGTEALQDWALFTSAKVTELWLRPNYASYESGERAVFKLQSQQLGLGHHRPVQWTYEMRVYKAKESTSSEADPVYTYPSDRFDQLYAAEGSFIVGRELAIERIPVPITLVSGYYAVELEAGSPNGEHRMLRQGFWGFDAGLLRQGDGLRCDRDYFWKNGRPLPIVGMTYMSSDVARKFLFMPNTAVWDRDMAQMKRAGINMIRTGIWTAWRQVMFIDGHPCEEVLRAIDAFILTAKRYDLEVVFNFFSFTPETWEGVNPYLDPRSIEAQKRFIAVVVSRHAETSNIHWDLINEPSMFDPKRIFQSGARSSHDPYERQAYVEWLQERHGTVRVLQERWNMTPVELPSFGSVTPPEPKDINYGTTPKAPKKDAQWLDYTLFSMDMHNRWAGQLIETIRAIQPKQLVTIGQDEGLVAQRPSPFFYAQAVDYTTVHSWWRMDDLVWDGVFSKDPHKPNLVQETGTMYVETPDGRAKRNEAELRNILERKYAYSFSTGGAGAVQWIWNINFYMNNVNESNIGALRADGTEKPEADVSYDFGSFMEQIRDLFQERVLEDTVVVFPYSNDLSSRKLAFEATTRLVRTLSYEMNVHVRGISEYHLESLTVWKPKLIIVPSAHNLSDQAWERLTAHVRGHGGTLLVTGPMGLDAYWRPVERERAGLGAAELRNVLREELLEVNGYRLPVSFGGAHIAQANKEVPANTEGSVLKLIEEALGNGRILWCPLPVELNQRLEPLKAVYARALSVAGVAPELEWLEGGGLAGIYGRKLSYEQGSLYIFVSEYCHPAKVEVKDPQTGRTYAFTVESERSVLFASDQKGELTAVYRPGEVTVAVQ